MTDKHLPITVLVVEDNEVDVEAIKRAFERSRIGNPMVFASDGIEALEMLRNNEVTAPYIILLDLNMPRMNGIEFLQEIRADEELRSSIVFVVTTSDDELDRAASYDLNVAGYIVKGNIGDGFLKLTSMLDRYWNVVTLPSQ